MGVTLLAAKRSWFWSREGVDSVKLQLDIPDDLVNEALTAAASLNSRQAEERRSVIPMKFHRKEAYNILIQWLKAVTVQDCQASSQRAMERAIQDRQEDLDARFPVD